MGFAVAFLDLVLHFQVLPQRLIVYVHYFLSLRLRLPDADGGVLFAGLQIDARVVLMLGNRISLRGWDFSREEVTLA